MVEVINKYLESKKRAWSKTTLRSTASRLKKHRQDIKDQNPEQVYDRLLEEGKTLYGIKTLFISIANLEDWGLLHQYPNLGAFRRFLNLQGRGAFKGAYNKEVIDKTYTEVKRDIQSIDDDTIRLTALYMLNTGLRIHELYKVKDNFVVGKGRKLRRIYGTKPERIARPHKLREALSKIGLKPHSLRKLFATKLINNGMPLQDVCTVMGWSSISTAMCYLQSSNELKLENKVNTILEA